MIEQDVLKASQIAKIRTIFNSYCIEEEKEMPIKYLEEVVRLVGYNPSKEEIEDMIEDLSPRTSINFNALLYIIYHHSRNYDPYKELIRAFRLFDKEETGVLKIQQIRQILKSIKQPFDDEQVNAVLSRADIENQEVEYEQIAKLLLNLD